MSFMVENRPTNEISNKDREHFLSLEVTEDYSFKVFVYVNIYICIYIHIYKPRLRRSMVRIFSPVLFSPRNAESGNSLEKRTNGRLSDRETKPEFPADANHFQKHSIRMDKRLFAILCRVIASAIS